jgi:hypothetical protein
MMMKSFDYYIKAEQGRAASEKAPIDAIYKSNIDRRWICIGDCVPETQALINQLLKKVR